MRSLAYAIRKLAEGHKRNDAPTPSALYSTVPFVRIIGGILRGWKCIYKATRRLWYVTETLPFICATGAAEVVVTSTANQPPLPTLPQNQPPLPQDQPPLPHNQLPLPALPHNQLPLPALPQNQPPLPQNQPPLPQNQPPQPRTRNSTNLKRGAIEGVTTYFKKCDVCGLRLRYQEYEDGLHNFNDQIILTIHFCLYLRKTRQQQEYTEMDITEDRLIDEISNLKVHAIRKLCTECKVDSKGSKMELIMRLRKEMETRSKYDKVFQKVWSASGGWAVIMCPCGQCTATYRHVLIPLRLQTPPLQNPPLQTLPLQTAPTALELLVHEIL
uniref:SAP domain-containing protein n=1 Tax=Knipowitschia caucasica TaxID=637954 RepID=A0AAV2J250_KNICA